MTTITTEELKNNIDKYLLLAEEEEIEVVDKDKTLFYFTPERVKLINRVEKMFASLPREAYDDDDIDRE